MSGIKFVAHLISLFNSVGIDWGKDEGDLLEKKKKWKWQHSLKKIGNGKKDEIKRIVKYKSN